MLNDHSFAKQLDQLELLCFQPEFRKDFNELNNEWLTNYFTVEAEDKRLLENPEEEILAKGGNIIFAFLSGKIVGTAALIHIDEGNCELTKMAVKPAFQGKQIGRLLLNSLIDYAKKKNYSRMILLTSTKLGKAISLYKSAGFLETEKQSSSGHNYKRCSIQMELKLVVEPNKILS
jgi:N-acetylglutamate synthase-like GNAT family acetyltransferase